MYHLVVDSMTYEIVDTDALLLSWNSVLDADAILLSLHWNIEMIEMLCFLSYTVVVSVVDEIVYIVSMLLSLNSVFDADAMLLSLHWNIEMIEMLCFLSYTVVVSVVDEIVDIVWMLSSLNSVLHLFHGDQIDIELALFFHHKAFAVLVLVEKIDFGLNLCSLFSYFDDFLFYCSAIVDKID